MENQNDKTNASTRGFTRRAFLNSAAVAAAGIAIVPRHVLGGVGYVAPSEKLNIAAVGVGGMGGNNVAAVASTENIVALCDIDENYAGKVFKRWPDAKRYVDYRKMLDEQKDIDAVIVATPDHTHAVVTLDAMQLGKHVYVQKPLTWSVFEARELAKAAKQYPKVVTQMGNQGHSGDGTRSVVEWIQAGVIGPVRQVYVWTNRPIWPQGVDRPTGNPEVPSGLAWDLFLGPAKFRPYNPAYTPFNWRGWVDYGTSAIGDMGAHLLDQPFWALNLGYPKSVETVSTRFNKDSWPLGSVSYYEFGPRGNMPALKLTWTDGGLFPPVPEEMGEDVLNREGGVLYVGDKGKIMHDTYGNNPRLLPVSKMDSFKAPAKTLPRIPNGTNGHEMNWVETIKGTQKISSPFEYATRLTEVMLLGVVALQAGRRIEYDGVNGKITNNDDANQYLHRQYRDGWSLK